ncbi:MAG: XRE family transcriptional regulator [Erysipelotrichaceae bacterium]|nr:XRE family transcriptional regulator [Erysipelotrichaceae bacterium]
MEIGKRIKQLRTRNNLTLEELASRCELTKGFLSQLERDLTSPSIITLENIVEALGLTMMEFFKEEKPEKVVFNKEDFFTDERDDLTIHWIVPNAQKNEMEPILIDLQPYQSSQIISPHEGEEFGYVLAGKVTLYNGEKKFIVRKGNTFYIKGNYTHYLKNEGNQLASFLWVCTPPIF